MVCVLGSLPGSFPVLQCPLLPGELHGVREVLGVHEEGHDLAQEQLGPGHERKTRVLAWDLFGARPRRTKLPLVDPQSRIFQGSVV